MQAAPKRLVVPVLFFAVALAAAFAWHSLASYIGFSDPETGGETVRIATQSAALLSGAWAAIRLLHLVVWQGIVFRSTGSAAPRLLTDLVDGVLWVSTIVIIIAFVFDKPVTGLIATSGVAVAVIGFALKSMISDLFSGIAITLERPFNMGDWIEITGGVIGKVITMSWRATGLMLESGVYVVVPNSRLSEMVLRVYDRPQSAWRDEIDILFGYDIVDEQVERIMISAAAEVPEVAAQAKSPDVRIVEFGDNSVKWRLRYWVPDFPSRSRLRYAVQRNILRNIHYSGIGRPVPRIHTQISRGDALSASVHDAEAFLRRINLFSALSADELTELAGNSDYRLVRAGTAIVRYGDSGDSLFIVKEGLLDVLIPKDGAEDIKVATLKSGNFFGEMSLLTGAERSATVCSVVDSMVIEISKHSLKPILDHREELMESISNILADRQMENQTAESKSSTTNDRQEAKQNLAKQLLGRIRSFFQ